MYIVAGSALQGNVCTLWLAAHYRAMYVHCGWQHTTGQCMYIVAGSTLQGDVCTLWLAAHYRAMYVHCGWQHTTGQCMYIVALQTHQSILSANTEIVVESEEALAVTILPSPLGSCV